MCVTNRKLQKSWAYKLLAPVKHGSLLICYALNSLIIIIIIIIIILHYCIVPHFDGRLMNLFNLQHLLPLNYMICEHYFAFVTTIM
jgi:hypothetical protein